MTGGHRKLPGSGVIRPEITSKWLYKAYKTVLVRLSSYRAVTRGDGSHMAGNDVTCSEVSGSDPEMTLFDRSQLEVAVEGL